MAMTKDIGQTSTVRVVINSVTVTVANEVGVYITVVVATTGEALNVLVGPLGIVTAKLSEELVM